MAGIIAPGPGLFDNLVDVLLGRRTIVRGRHTDDLRDRSVFTFLCVVFRTGDEHTRHRRPSATAVRGSVNSEFSTLAHFKTFLPDVNVDRETDLRAHEGELIHAIHIDTRARAVRIQARSANGLIVHPDRNLDDKLVALVPTNIITISNGRIRTAPKIRVVETVHGNLVHLSTRSRSGQVPGDGVVDVCHFFMFDIIGVLPLPQILFCPVGCLDHFIDDLAANSLSFKVMGGACAGAGVPCVADRVNLDGTVAGARRQSETGRDDIDIGNRSRAQFALSAAGRRSNGLKDILQFSSVCRRVCVSFAVIVPGSVTIRPDIRRIPCREPVISVIVTDKISHFRRAQPLGGSFSKVDFRVVIGIIDDADRVDTRNNILRFIRNILDIVREIDDSVSAIPSIITACSQACYTTLSSSRTPRSTTARDAICKHDGSPPFTGVVIEILLSVGLLHTLIGPGLPCGSQRIDDTLQGR